MTEVSSIVELRRLSGAAIIAVPYRSGRPLRPMTLPDGAIVERPDPDERQEAPAEIDGLLGVAAGGVAATVHHRNLGLVTGFLPLAGVYLLPGGPVAAVYGATEEPIG